LYCIVHNVIDHHEEHGHDDGRVEFTYQQSMGDSMGVYATTASQYLPGKCSVVCCCCVGVVIVYVCVL